MHLDHLILNINDLDETLDFYTEVMGFPNEGEDGPFTVLRVTPDFTIAVAPWGTEGGTHLAFAMSKQEFNEALARIQAANLPYGDSYHTPNNQQGPGQEQGAKGQGQTYYLLDPNKHLIEIRHYE